MNCRLVRCVTFASIAMLIGFSACSESESGVKVQEQGDGGAEVSTFDDLPNCTSKRNGDSIYVRKDDLTYVCKDGVWSDDTDDDVSSYKTEDDLPNCTAKREGEQAYIKDEKITFVCKDEEWVEDENTSSNSKDGKSSSSIEEGDEAESSTSTEVEVTELKDSRDGKVYKVTKIGKQVWMAENLNYDGGSWYCPSGSRTDDQSCKKYGKLYGISGGYSYSGVGSLDNLCPDGWVVPSDEDWSTLIQYVDQNNGQEGVGKSLKATKGWYEEGYQQVDEYSSMIREAVAVGKDKFGFSALPAGSCWTGSCYTDDETRFWTASGYGMKLSFDSDDFTLDEDVATGAGYISLRCIQDVVLGTCGKANAGEIKEGHNAYICDSGEWRLATGLEMDLGLLGACTAALEGGKKAGDHGMYVCTGGEWHDVNDPDIVLGTCDEDNDGSIGYINTEYSFEPYICDGGEWRLTKAYETDLGLCNENNDGRVVSDSWGDYHLCNKGEWQQATLEDYLGPCNAANEGAVSDDLNYTCRDGEWMSGYSYNDAKGSLWSMSVPAFQVQTPEVVQCTGGDPNSMADYGKACFESTGGWWFAYDNASDSPDITANVVPADRNADGSWKLITTDEEDGAILPGGNLVEGVGLMVTMSITGVDVANPGVVGIGFNWMKNGMSGFDISSYDGFCIDYSLSGDSIQMVLGWDMTNGPDEYYYELPSGSNVLDIPWDWFQNEGWGQELGYFGTLDDALTDAVKLLFRIKNPTSSEMRSTFVIHSLGWLGECGSSSSSSTSGGY